MHVYLVDPRRTDTDVGNLASVYTPYLWPDSDAPR